ncbi:MAG TPA: hypothetical protein VMF06_08995 [Candidatus Limnocylindria bacterium]|nr:hypothetical protein [Candidatus Limnocylindria bacterium]
MKFLERTFEVSGREGLGAKPRPELIGPVLTHLHDTLQDVVRMGFLHSSRARGRIPSGLKAAAEVHYLGHSLGNDGTTLLRFEVPSFGSVATELFSQKRLWEDGPQPEQTAFELLGGALVDVRNRRKDSNRFDTGLLRRIGTYRRMLNRGIDRIQLPDTAISELGRIDIDAVDAATELCAATPSSRRVRVAGRLDLLGASQAVLKLDIRPGVFVTALWEGEMPLDDLKEYFNRDVVLEGVGIFRPSGSLLRVDASAIAFAGAQDDFFRSVPQSGGFSSLTSSIGLRPGERSRYGRILGAIPGEESDEAFIEAIERLG